MLTPCRRIPGQACPRDGCPGVTDPGACDHVAWTNTLPRQPPGLLAMAGSFASAVVGHLVAGSPIAPEEVQAARRATCLACPLHDAAPDSCRACGCNLTIKRSWLDQDCPEGRWVAPTANPEPVTDNPGDRP